MSKKNNSFEENVNELLDKRLVKTLLMTLILFIIGLSDYFIGKSIELGGVVKH
jgi:hypothetical protein